MGQGSTDSPFSAGQYGRIDKGMVPMAGPLADEPTFFIMSLVRKTSAWKVTEFATHTPFLVTVLFARHSRQEQEPWPGIQFPPESDESVSLT
jgi:hypothetical protein